MCYVERDDYCVDVLKQRIDDGWLDDAPIWDDVQTFNGRPWRGKVDVLTAGPPCQPVSQAGDQQLAEHEADCWSDTLRVVREARPRYILLENPPAIVTSGRAGGVLGHLADLGYDAVWDCLSAGDLGAPHERDRWWCLATDTDRDGESARPVDDLQAQELPATGGPARGWPDRPDALGVDDGMAHRMERLRSLGNGQCAPQMAAAVALLARRLALVLHGV